MKSKIIVLSAPQQWSFTDKTTGQFRTGNSGLCFLPFEGVGQTFSNLPVGCQENFVYDCELGFRQTKDSKGNPKSELRLITCSSTGKPINWENICK